MSLSNTFANDLALLIFNNTTIAGIGDAGGLLKSVADGSLYFALHTADPGEAGNQQSNECTYTGYARKAVIRTAAGFTVSGVQVSNTGAVTFDQCTAGTNTATHWTIGMSLSGTGKILLKGPLGSSVQGPFTAAVSDTITIPGTTLIVNDQVAFYPTKGSSLPTGITEGTFYFVKTVSGNDITIAATQGGATIDLTVAGDGIAFKVQSLAISATITPNFAAAAFVATFD